MKLDELFAAAVRSGAHIGGVAITATSGDVVYEAGFGTKVHGGEPVTADTPFRIASMTKAMTSVGLLQLVEQGRIGLDDEVASVIPEFGDLSVLAGLDGDEPRLRPPTSHATVRQLLNHTAGFGYSFLNEKLARYHAVTGVPDALSFSRAMFETPLVNDPGVAWEYGISTDWAGHVVEAISGSRLEEYLSDHLWRPLGMTNTTFEPREDVRSQLMPVHSRLADGSLAPNGIELPVPPEVCSGGAGAYSTARDYARFMRALLRGGELDGSRILGEETVELMFTPSLGDLEVPAIIRSVNAVVCNDIPAPPVPTSWGLGLHVVLEDLPDMRRAGTGDWCGLPNCYFWIDRASGICAAVLTQVLPFFDQRIVETALKFEAAVYAALGSSAAQ